MSLRFGLGGLGVYSGLVSSTVTCSCSAVFFNCFLCHHASIRRNRFMIYPPDQEQPQSHIHDGLSVPSQHNVRPPWHPQTPPWWEQHPRRWMDISLGVEAAIITVDLDRPLSGFIVSMMEPLSVDDIRSRKVDTKTRYLMGMPSVIRIPVDTGVVKVDLIFIAP